MQAFLAILRYDLGQLTRSWITRIWLPLLVASALVLVAVAANQDELASETLAFYLRAILIPISGLAVAVLSSAAVSASAFFARASAVAKRASEASGPLPEAAANAANVLSSTCVTWTALIEPCSMKLNASWSFCVNNVILRLSRPPAICIS